jgi:hypothetical protein
MISEHSLTRAVREGSAAIDVEERFVPGEGAFPGERALPAEGAQR